MITVTEEDIDDWNTRKEKEKKRYTNQLTIPFYRYQTNKSSDKILINNKKPLYRRG